MIFNAKGRRGLLRQMWGSGIGDFMESLSPPERDNEDVVFNRILTKRLQLL